MRGSNATGMHAVCGNDQSSIGGVVWVARPFTEAALLAIAAATDRFVEDVDLAYDPRP